MSASEISAVGKAAGERMRDIARVWEGMASRPLMVASSTPAWMVWSSFSRVWMKLACDAGRARTLSPEASTIAVGSVICTA